MCMRNQQTEENKRHHEMFGMSLPIKYDYDAIALHSLTSKAEHPVQTHSVVAISSNCHS